MMTVRDIAAVLGSAVEGDAATGIGRVAKIEEAAPGDITFLANPKYKKHLESTLASAVIIGRTVETPARTGRSQPVFLRVDDPYTSFLKVLLLFNPPGDPLAPGIHPTAVVEPGVNLGTDVRIGPHVVVGERCRIGDGTMILAGTVIGRDVTVGARTLLYANVTVREGCRIGDRVIIHPGAVIGSDGFGFAPKPDGSYEKIPQLGIVVVDSRAIWPLPTIRNGEHSPASTVRSRRPGGRIWGLLPCPSGWRRASWAPCPSFRTPWRKSADCAPKLKPCREKLRN